MFPSPTTECITIVSHAQTTCCVRQATSTYARAFASLPKVNDVAVLATISCTVTIQNHVAIRAIERAILIFRNINLVKVLHAPDLHYCIVQYMSARVECLSCQIIASQAPYRRTLATVPLPSSNMVGSGGLYFRSFLTSISC
jgi:hypothetical protein